MEKEVVDLSKIVSLRCIFLCTIKFISIMITKPYFVEILVL